jgi:hypothetical protein
MTDQFPRGKLNADDEGALNIGITVRDRTMIIDFGKPCDWIGLDKQTALALADTIRKRAEEL